MSKAGIQRQGAAALHLRLSGASFADIATTLALSGAREAYDLVLRELGDHAEMYADQREALRVEESERLMTLLRPVMARATDPDDPEHLAAVRTAVSIIDRRIKLHGLDAPTEVTIHTPTQTELDLWVAQMVAHTMPVAALAEPDIVDAEVVV